jgi:hypothetical protein
LGEDNNKLSDTDLASIKLVVKNQTYDLHPMNDRVFYHGEVRIYGSSPTPMTAYIINPLKISGIAIKIFVRSTDATRGQEDFKKLVLQGQCSEIAKRVYKVVNSDNVRLRSQPNDNAKIRSTLAKGSFIKTLQIVDDWSEVITPESRQGWIKTDLLTIINR